MEKTQNTKTVESGQHIKVHYIGTLDDGTEFDNSYTREETLDFEVGNEMLLEGFNLAVVGMQEGETKSFKLAAGDAYGDHNPEATTTVDRAAFPANFKFDEGATVEGTTGDGRPVIAKIISFTEEDVTLDLNHPLAGQDLNFKIELIEIQSDNETTEE